jgi:hypothetical protein
VLAPEAQRFHNRLGQWEIVVARLGLLQFPLGQGPLRPERAELLAPFLLVAILIIASNMNLMQGQPSSRLGWSVVAFTTVAMFAAAVAMFVV